MSVYDYWIRNDSPWSDIQSCVVLFEAKLNYRDNVKLICSVYSPVLMVSTAGHGGLMIDTALADILLSKEAIAIAEEEGAILTYEEDCASAVPLWELYHSKAVILPWYKERTEEYVETLQQSIERWYPEYYENTGKGLVRRK